MKLRALLITVSLSCGGTSGCSGEDVAAVAPGQERPALVGGSVDANTTGVLAVFLSAAGQWLFGCTGTLVAPNVVLTAGHCVLAFDPAATTRAAACEGDSMPHVAAPEDIVVVSGVNADQSTFAVERLAVPSMSAGRALDLCGNDLGLLVLKEPVPPSEAEPLALRVTEGVSLGETFDTVGFGPDAPQAIPDENVRRRASGSIACVAAECDLDDDVHDGEWRSDDTFACPGDSGAPALDQAGQVIGVVSRGFPDCHSIIYEDVFGARDFLERELSAANASTAEDSAGAAGNPEREAVPGSCALGVDRGQRAPSRPAWASALLVTAAVVRRLRRAGARVR